MRILIVEDEKKFNDILQRSLKSEGYTVDGVLTAEDGLELYQIVSLRPGDH